MSSLQDICRPHLNRPLGPNPQLLLTLKRKRTSIPNLNIIPHRNTTYLIIPKTKFNRPCLIPNQSISYNSIIPKPRINARWFWNLQNLSIKINMTHSNPQIPDETRPKRVTPFRHVPANPVRIHKPLKRIPLFQEKILRNPQLRHHHRSFPHQKNPTVYCLTSAFNRKVSTHYPLIRPSRRQSLEEFVRVHTVFHRKKSEILA